MTSRFLSGLVAAALLLLSGCKDPSATAGSTSGAALYAFDSTTSTVLVWTDLGTLYTTPTAATPTKTLTSSAFTKVTNMAWGGVCLDSSSGILYLVSADGNIVRVKNLRSQSGAVTSTDVVSFQLASSTPFLSNSTFGQAAIDSSTNTLYITEANTSSTRIWVVPNASSQLQDASVALQALQVTGDSGGTGVAAGGGVAYAFFKDGNGVGIDLLGGPRLRQGNASSFSSSNTIVGSLTTLGIYGSLALDTGNSYLYVARHNTDAVSTLAPVLAFKTGQFGATYNQAPSQSLGSSTEQADLRVLAHAGVKDWLVGLSGGGTTSSSVTPTGYAKIHLWKSPLSGTAAVVVTTTSGSVLKGLAVDGNAS